MSNTTSTTPKTLQEKISSAPTYMKALPVIGFGAGFAYGKLVKKCWGCAFGFGAAGFVVGSIPLIVHINKLEGVEVKKQEAASDNKPTTGNAGSATSATVTSILETLAEVSEKNNRKAQYEAQKEKIKQLATALTEKEQSALLDLLNLMKSISGKSASPQQALTILSSGSATIEKKYGTDFMKALNQKMAKLQTELQITPFLNSPAEHA